MFVIIVLSGLLAVFAAWFLARPTRGLSADEEQRVQLELMRDEALNHLREIDADCAGGRMDETVAREEKRRIEHELAGTLKALEAEQAAAKRSLRAMPHRGLVTVSLLVMLPILAGGLDYWQNKPALLTFATLNAKGQVRGVHGVPPMVLSMVAKLKRSLRAHPHDLHGWEELARANVVLGNLKGARKAYAHAYALAPHDVNVLADYAWLLYTAQPTKTTGLVDTLYRHLYAREPRQQDALWFLGLADYNRGHLHRTLSYWTRLARELPPGSKAERGVATAVQAVRKRLAAATPTPRAPKGLNAHPAGAP